MSLSDSLFVYVDDAKIVTEFPWIFFQTSTIVGFRCIDFRVGHLRKELGENYYKEILSSKKRLGRFNPAAKQVITEITDFITL